MTVIYKILSFLFLFFFISCGKCPCVDSDLSPNFILFDKADVDTIIVSKYVKNSNFTLLIDTTFFSETNAFSIKKSNDTISFPARVGNFSISANYDWMFFLQGVNRTFKISEIVSPQVSLPCPDKVQCVNPIISLKIDGVNYVPEYYNFYMRK